jgi:hypothetical protein
MKYLSKLTTLLVVLLSGMVSAGPSKPLELGFADCHTVRAAKVKGEPQEYVPSIVIRFLSKDGSRESFAVSHNEGYVSVPLRPGTYCFEAYDRKGLRLELDAEQARCFDLRAQDSLEVGVVLAAK